MNLDLTGKRALVCGGSRGIGYASAQALAELGAEIILLARNEELLAKNVASLNSINGLENKYIKADIADSVTLKELISIELELSSIEILINNTGGPKSGFILDATPEDFLSAIQNHLIASHTLVQLLTPYMKKASYGRIINIVSTSVRQPIPYLGVSNTTRGMIASWAKTLSNELAPFAITVNNVLPGTTQTERIEELVNSLAAATNQSTEDIKVDMKGQIPMGRFAEVHEIGDVIAFLASPAASYITGTSIPVDGGKIRSI